MKLFGDKKLLSRERVVGISLADILLQAVFLLFIALVIGYEDPVILLKTQEFEEFGKDLCKKKHTNTLTECKEQIKNEDKFIEVGNRLCSGKYDNADKCVEAYLDASKFKEKNKGSLVACMPVTSVNAQPAVEFVVLSNTQFEFIGFTTAYKDYLKRNNDEYRQKLVERLKAKQIFTVSQIEDNFGFMKQADCFQVPKISPANQEMKHSETSFVSNKIRAAIMALSKSTKE